MEKENLQSQIDELKREIDLLKSSSTIPLYIDQAFVGRGFLKNPLLTGILKGNGITPITAITPKSGTGSFYVAASSGGAVTTKVDWSSGIITAIT